MSAHWVALDEGDVDESPFGQFARWFDEADSHMAEREAVCLVTSTPHGAPSARMVLLRHHDGATFGWFTNYESCKGREIAANPFAALLWYCEGLGRQIRIEGTVEKMSREASDAYFATRPRASQIGARASFQSRVLPARGDLERRVEEITRVYEGLEVPRPDDWGGYQLTPRRFEFWQHREDRLHDRIVYECDEQSWRRERLSP